MYLLDTHIFLWMVTEPEKLSRKIKNIVSDKSNVLYLSVASLWEISLKYSLDKIKVPDYPEKFLLKELQELNINILPISPYEALSVYKLPHIHKDPFDRILIIQAVLNNLVFISNDKVLRKYNLDNLNILW